ncbi:hypothetical protein EVAR_12774_1 [Eumeta japonica]|uniref:Uncharacterized protein n=1 Tax=Eumeta variegata TaxID=151549 RepID=A0A4C1UC25_EUMVA|nr:hypothetical protein EVAR_12774_1 [Eumeta japonica]
MTPSIKLLIDMRPEPVPGATVISSVLVDQSDSELLSSSESQAGTMNGKIRFVCKWLYATFFKIPVRFTTSNPTTTTEVKKKRKRDRDREQEQERGQQLPKKNNCTNLLVCTSEAKGGILVN